MMRDTSGGAGYVPKRTRSEEAGSSGDEGEGSAIDANLAREVKVEVCPPGEEANAVPTSGFGRKVRKTRVMLCVMTPILAGIPYP
jgi:hypothetical protein